MKECQVVQDLWPLYIDRELQEGTEKFIEEHLESCNNCQSLRVNQFDIDSIPVKLNAELNGLIESDFPGSPEKFMLKLKRQRQLVIGAIILGVLIFGLGIWRFTDYRLGQSYSEKQQAEIQFLKEQLVALEEVSPNSKSMLNELGIEFISDAVVTGDKGLQVKYRFAWGEESPVAYIVQDRHWFNEESIVDGKSGAALQFTGGGYSSDANGLQGTIDALLPHTQPKSIIYRTKTLYAFLEEQGANVTIPFDYDGEDKKIPVNKEFSYQGVDFKINHIDANSDEFVIEYEQLTPAQEVGVYQLDFVLDDRLGNRWGVSPDIELMSGNPKRFTISTPHSLAKHWNLNVKHVVKVIPGISQNLSINDDGGQK